MPPQIRLSSCISGPVDLLLDVAGDRQPPKDPAEFPGAAAGQLSIGASLGPTQPPPQRGAGLLNDGWEVGHQLLLFDRLEPAIGFRDACEPNHAV